MYFVYEYLLGIVELFGSLLSTTKGFWDANEQSKTFAGFLCLFVCVGARLGSTTTSTTVGCSSSSNSSGSSTRSNSKLGQGSFLLF